MGQNNERIVCAAMKMRIWEGKIECGEIIAPSIRHWDNFAHKFIAFTGIPVCLKGDVCSERGYYLRVESQGFLTNTGRYVERKEAFDIASAAGQILKKTGGEDSKILFSGDIY
ncbi:hypothetical protein ACWA5Z_06470 [Testudinibacter sp. P80/BLE/0925]